MSTRWDDGPLFDDMPDAYRPGVPTRMWPEEVHLPPRPAFRELPRDRGWPVSRRAGITLVVLAVAVFWLAVMVQYAAR